MSTENINTNNATTQDHDTIDKEQMIAGLELGRVLIDYHTHYPNKNVDKDKVMEQLADLVIPERFKDLSCEDVQKMTIDHYTRKVSMAMAANHLDGKLEVAIPTKHAKYVAQLTCHWTEKGFSTTAVPTESGGPTITIEW